MMRRVLSILAATSVAWASTAPLTSFACPMGGAEAPCPDCNKAKGPAQLLNPTCCEFQAQAAPQPAEAVTHRACIKSPVLGFVPVFLPAVYAAAPLRPVARLVSATSPPPIQFNRPLLH